MLATEIQNPPSEIKLDAAVVPVLNYISAILQRILSALCLDFTEQSGPMFKIHGSAVVRVHQTKVPKFTSLVEIRHTGARHLQQDLCQTVHHPTRSDVALKFQEII